MQIEFILIPLNLKTGKRACLASLEQPADLTINLDTLFEKMKNSQIPNLLPGEWDLRAFIAQTAYNIADMYDADVYYREVGTEYWHFRKGCV